VAAIIPLVLVCAVRAGGFALRRAGRRAGFELALAGGALAAAAAASLVLRAITSAGGFTVRPLGPRLASPGEIFWHNLPVAGQCLLLLFGAYPGGPSTAARAIAVLHLAGVLLAALAVGAAARRLRRDGDLVSQVLLVGIAVNLGAFLVTQRAVDVTSAREIAPVLPFAAALAARQLSPALARARRRQATGAADSPGPARADPLRLAGRLTRRLLAVAGAGYVAGLGVELTAPAAPPQAAPLTAWLTSHRLGGTGLAGYWQASVVTLTSGGTVAVRPVDDSGGGVGAHPGEVKDTWFDPRRSAAHFVVLSPSEPGYPGYTGYRAVRATWGSPARIYHVGQYTIWYWPENLLSTIHHQGEHLSGGQS
ncbi:MAG TPA: hypothetical protein VN714_06625, partial [Trebonia sp.]|nr:hypothetical protein [Trebonia sp.]